MQQTKPGAKAVLALGTLAALAVPLLSAMPASATPGSGFSPSLIVGGNLGPVEVRADDKLAGDGNNRSNHWDLLLKTKDQSDIGVFQINVAPGGYSGWHTHPGVSLLTVKSGTITWYDGNDCSATTYYAGDSFIEPANHLHNVQNRTGAAVQLIGVNLRPDSAPVTVDSPGPTTCHI